MQRGPGFCFDGKQRKAYIDVVDCVNAMLMAYEKAEPDMILNLATYGQTSVKDIAKLVTGRVAPDAKIKYTGSVEGWPGDVPDTYMDNSKMLGLGIRLKYADSIEVVTHAVDTLVRDSNATKYL